MGVIPRHEGGARGRAQRVGVMVFQNYARVGQFLQVGRDHVRVVPRHLVPAWGVVLTGSEGVVSGVGNGCSWCQKRLLREVVVSGVGGDC